MEYEEATLGLAKAKANRRAIDAQNEIMLQKVVFYQLLKSIISLGNDDPIGVLATSYPFLLDQAEATAKSIRITAQGRKSARILDAGGEAEAMRIEAKGRNDAAMTMSDEYGRTYQLAQVQVEFADKLKATSVTVLPDSAVGRPFVANMSK